MRFVEDPSISGAARAEHARLHAELIRRYQAGEDWFRAREKIMADEGPMIAKLYGKETAKRALNALCSYGPADVKVHVQRAYSKSWKLQALRESDEYNGGLREYPPFVWWLYEETSIPDLVSFLLIVAMIAAACALVLSAIVGGWGPLRFVFWPCLAVFALGAVLDFVFPFKPRVIRTALTGKALEEHQAALLQRQLDDMRREREAREAAEDETRRQREEERASAAAIRRMTRLIEREQRVRDEAGATDLAERDRIERMTIANCRYLHRLQAA